MRTAAILGPRISPKRLKPFQEDSDGTWHWELPARSEEADAILVLGGDGTLHRHLTQLVRLRLPVLVVPCGSGNDFARAMGLFGWRDSLAAWRKFSRGGGNIRTIDLGTISALGDRDTSHAVYFCSVGGVGLDAEIARRANELPNWLRGRSAYALGMPAALAGFTPVSMRIRSCEGECFPPISGKFQPIMVAAFANTPMYGGGMRIAPLAKWDDGLLDICLVREMPKFELFVRFATIYCGRHINFPQVEYFRSRSLVLETATPCSVYADGEHVCATPVEVGVVKGALTVIVP